MPIFTCVHLQHRDLASLEAVEYTPRPMRKVRTRLSDCKISYECLVDHCSRLARMRPHLVYVRQCQYCVISGPWLSFTQLLPAITDCILAFSLLLWLLLMYHIHMYVVKFVFRQWWVANNAEGKIRHVSWCRYAMQLFCYCWSLLLQVLLLQIFLECFDTDRRCGL